MQSVDNCKTLVINSKLDPIISAQFWSSINQIIYRNCRFTFIDQIVDLGIDWILFPAVTYPRFLWMNDIPTCPQVYGKEDCEDCACSCLAEGVEIELWFILTPEWDSIEKDCKDKENGLLSSPPTDPWRRLDIFCQETIFNLIRVVNIIIWVCWPNYIWILFCILELFQTIWDCGFRIHNMKANVWNHARPGHPVLIIELFIKVACKSDHTCSQTKERWETVIIMYSRY